MKFTGGDNLTGFKKLINDIFMRNELYNGDGGYEISHAKAGRSGYSFGPVQWDPSTGHIIKKGNTPEEDVRLQALSRSKVFRTVPGFRLPGNGITGLSRNTSLYSRMLVSKSRAILTAC